MRMACPSVAGGPRSTPAAEPLNWATLDSLGYTVLPLGRVQSIGPTPSAAVPPHVVVGAVFDAVSGEPLANARVSVSGRPSVVSDSRGRFHISGVGEHDSLFIHAIGSSALRLGLTMPATRGILVLAILPRNPLVLCELVSPDPHPHALPPRVPSRGPAPTPAV